MGAQEVILISSRRKNYYKSERIKEMSNDTPLADLLNKGNPFAAKDRSNLNLPEIQTCIECHVPKHHSEFNLKKRNPYTKHLPSELEDVCRECKAMNKDIKRGTFSRAMKSGNWLLSDAVVDGLINDNQRYLKAIANILLEAAAAGDMDAITKVIMLAQGKPPQTKLLSKPNDNQSQEDSSEAEANSSNVQEADKLLERIK